MLSFGLVPWDAGASRPCVPARSTFPRRSIRNEDCAVLPWPHAANSHKTLASSILRILSLIRYLPGVTPWVPNTSCHAPVANRCRSRPGKPAKPSRVPAVRRCWSLQCAKLWPSTRPPKARPNRLTPFGQCTVGSVSWVGPYAGLAIFWVLVLNINHPVSRFGGIDPYQIAKLCPRTCLPFMLGMYAQDMKKGLDRRTDEPYAAAIVRFHIWEAVAGGVALIGVALIAVGMILGKQQAGPAVHPSTPG